MRGANRAWFGLVVVLQTPFWVHRRKDGSIECTLKDGTFDPEIHRMWLRKVYPPMAPENGWLEDYTLENQQLEPKNHQLKKENHLPNLHFLGFKMCIFSRVWFQFRPIFRGDVMLVSGRVVVSLGLEWINLLKDSLTHKEAGEAITWIDCHWRGWFFFGRKNACFFSSRVPFYKVK